MNSSPLIRIASIGLGWVTLNRHIPAIKRQPRLKLAGVIDRDAMRAAQIGHRLNVPHFASHDLGNIPWLDQIDAFAIGAAPFAHAELAVQALSLGKHVLVEKPFAMNRAEGGSMVAAAKANNRMLAVVHNFQFSRAMHRLARDLSSGHLGEIHRIAAVQLGNPKRRLPQWYANLPLGLFYDESPHFFYLLRDLASTPLALKHAHAIEDPDGGSTPCLVSLLYKTENDIPVTIECQFDSAISEWYVLVTGSQALGILDIFRDIYIRLPNDGAHGLARILRTSFCATMQHWAQHIPNGIAYLRGRLAYGNDEVFARFAAAIASGKPPIGLSGEDALAVLTMQHEACDALRANMI